MQRAVCVSIGDVSNLGALRTISREAKRKPDRRVPTVGRLGAWLNPLTSSLCTASLCKRNPVFQAKFVHFVCWWEGRFCFAQFSFLFLFPGYFPSPRFAFATQLSQRISFRWSSKCSPAALGGGRCPRLPRAGDSTRGRPKGRVRSSMILQFHVQTRWLSTRIWCLVFLGCFSSSSSSNRVP